MDATQKKSIKSTILKCRDLLENDIESVLLQYGINDEEWLQVNSLFNLNDEQKEIRKKIETAIIKLENGGFERAKARSEYIKEVSYTYLNRISAIKVMESRGLIDEIFIKKDEYGGQSLIVNRLYEVSREYCKYSYDDGLGYALTLIFNEISNEINVLFNTDDEFSFIMPTSTTLSEVIKLLCSNIEESTWRQDEIIGWIYQFFNDKEKEDVFDRLYKKKQKIKIEDIPAATQLFTPEYIVNWLISGSLGELHNDILKNNNKRIEDIKVLDPCCGSGHFLVKAYDMLYNMYIEEGKYSIEEIPYKILEKNLFGVDIDLRAIQLTALMLFIKTKSLLKGTKSEGKEFKFNLVCADTILINGKRLEELKQRYNNNSTILNMIDIIYDEFNNTRMLGSLIMPEKKIYPLFKETQHKVEKKKQEKAKRNLKKQVQGQLNVINNMNIDLCDASFIEEEKNLMNTLIMVYQEAIKATDINKQLFANEVVKSIKLIEIFMNEYDVVLTNPPYMGKRNMNIELKEFLNSNYKGYDGDLYSVFIVRCIEFAKKNGYIGMLTQQSFMFTSTYEEIRNRILNSCTLEKVLHLGTKAFDEIKGEKVSTVAFILKNDNCKKDHLGKYYRLVDLNSPDDKKAVILDERELEKYKYRINQEEFKLIKGSPFIYWMSNAIKELFKYQKPLGDIADCVAGISTGNNLKFLRFIWEKPNHSSRDFRNYVKGGEYKKYYGNLEYIIDWNLEEIKKESGARVHGVSYFGRKGITYSLTSGVGFSARELPEGYIFDHSGNCIFIDENLRMYLLGVLNSKLVNSFLAMLNPTLSFQAGDLKRVPVIANPDKKLKEIIEKLVLENIELQKKIEQSNEPNRDFNKPILLINKENSIKQSYIKSREYILDIYDKIEKNQNIIDEIVCELYCIDKSELQMLESIVENDENIQVKTFIDEYNDIYDITRLGRKYNISISEIKNSLGMHEINNNEIKIEVTKLISYFIGKIFKCTDEEIIPIGLDIFTNSILEKLYDQIAEEFDEENIDNIISEIEIILDMSMEEFVISEFYEVHKKLYSKRPIYWHFSSNKKTFNVLVNYHKLTNDTIYKIKSIYLKKMIDRFNEDLSFYKEKLVESTINEDKLRIKEYRIKVDSLEIKLNELNEYDNTINSYLQFKPDVDAGILMNAVKIENLLRSRISTDSELKKMEKK